MLTQLFRDSEVAQCILLPLIASTFIPSSVPSSIHSFIHHSPLSSQPRTSLPRVTSGLGYGTGNCHGPSLISLVQ